MARYYLDEDLPLSVAVAGRSLGLDVIRSHESGRDGLSDDEQLRLAALDQRCFVTRNRDDFIVLTTQCFAQGSPHAGVLIVPRSLPNRDPGRMARALLAFDEIHESELPSYTLLFLSDAPDA